MAYYTFGVERYLQPQFVIEILLPIFSIGLTLVSIMIELQQVINMCLDFSEDEDEQYANRGTINPATGRPMRESDLYVDEPTEDAFFESVIVGLWKILYDLMDLEIAMFPLFFGHARRLQASGERLRWLCVVTAPFYASVYIMLGLLWTSLSDVDDDGIMKQPGE